MDLHTISNLVIEYRYWILIPLSFVEGPVVAIAAGTLASLGYFNVYILALFFLVLDLGKDAFYYAIGHWGGNTKFMRRVLKRVGVHQGHLDDVHALWEKNPGKTMFLGKISYGIASSFIVLAGTVRMSLKKFFGWGALVAMSQYWTLLALGYFFGSSLSTSSEHLITNIQYGIGIVALIGSGYYIFSIFIRSRWKKENDGM